MHETSESQQKTAKPKKDFRVRWQFFVDLSPSSKHFHIQVVVGLAFLSSGEKNIPLLNYIKLSDPNS